MKVVLRFFQILAIFCMLSCFFVEGFQYNLEKCGIRDVERIVGGNAAEHGEYPWMVSIHYNGRHWCGGTIIQHFWILTAAHCIESLDPRRYEIHAGIHKLTTSSQRIPTFAWKKFEVFKIIPFREYNSSNFDNDIALIYTRDPIIFKTSGGYINGICLPSKNRDPVGMGTAIGWGLIEYNGKMSEVLKEVNVPIIPRRNCPRRMTKNMICAGGEIDQGSCHGDSGGPLMQMDRRGVYWIVGVVSHGIGCAWENAPGIYAKVARYIRWIEKTMRRTYY